MLRLLAKTVSICMVVNLAACSHQPVVTTGVATSTISAIPTETVLPTEAHSSQSADAVEAKAWRLLSLPQAFVEGPSMRDVYIRFYPAKGMFEGHTGCNVIRGKYKLNSEQISMNEFAGSNLPCDVITFEAVYIQALSESTYWQLTENKLTLLDENKQRLAVFEGQ